MTNQVALKEIKHLKEYYQEILNFASIGKNTKLAQRHYDQLQGAIYALKALEYSIGLLESTSSITSVLDINLAYEVTT